MFAGLKAPKEIQWADGQTRDSQDWQASGPNLVSEVFLVPVDSEEMVCRGSLKAGIIEQFQGLEQSGQFLVHDQLFVLKDPEAENVSDDESEASGQRPPIWVPISEMQFFDGRRNYAYSHQRNKGKPQRKIWHLENKKYAGQGLIPDEEAKLAYYKNKQKQIRAFNSDLSQEGMDAQIAQGEQRLLVAQNSAMDHHRLVGVEPTEDEMLREHVPPEYGDLRGTACGPGFDPALLAEEGIMVFSAGTNPRTNPAFTPDQRNPNLRARIYGPNNTTGVVMLPDPDCPGQMVPCAFKGMYRCASASTSQGPQFFDCPDGGSGDPTSLDE